MSWKPIVIMVDCQNEKEQKAVQQTFDKISGVLKLQGKTVLEKAPLIEKNQAVIRQLFDLISKNGLSMSLFPK